MRAGGVVIEEGNAALRGADVVLDVQAGLVEAHVVEAAHLLRGLLAPGHT